MRYSITAGCCVLLCVVFSNPSWTMPGPPPEARTVENGGEVFYTGMVYVSSPGDTAKLKALGFRIVECEGRSFSSTCYRVQWPESVIAHPTPDYVTGIVYDAPDRRQASRSIDMGGTEFSSVGLSIPYRGSNVPPPVSQGTGAGKGAVASTPYVHGTILCRSARDTTDLKRLGFSGFESSKGSAESGGEKPQLVFRATWPATLDTNRLPVSVRLASGQP